MNIRQLQNLDPAGWTELLAQTPETRGAIVTAVDADALARGRHLIRYTLTLSDQSDPITFIGKQSSAAEALFFRNLAADLAGLAPRSWFTDVIGGRGWIIMADVPADRPVVQWDNADIDTVMRNLARLHAAYWDMDAFLAQYEWLPHFRTPDPSVAGLRYELNVASIVSDHAVQVTGRFAPNVLQAARGLQALRRLRLWPQVFDERHLRAATDLLDDPMPLMEPLRRLPVTLLHGDPDPHHWHLTLFDDCRLFDWRSVIVGPAPLDVVTFVEQLYRRHLLHGDWATWRDQQLFEQTTIDSYLLAMSAELEDRFSASDVRQALPGAVCLFTLTHWFPTLNGLPDLATRTGRQWRDVRELDDEALRAAGLTELAQTRTHLQALFNRFLQAYRSL